MELGRVGEAEPALAAFDREARAAGDAAAVVMVVVPARHAGGDPRPVRRCRSALIEQVAEQGRRAGLADTDRLVGTVRWAMVVLRGDPPAAGAEAGLEQLRAFSRRSPGHLYDATAARLLVALGRAAEAGLELQRALPGVLAGSGPRWLGAAADLAVGGGRDRGHRRRGPPATRRWPATADGWWCGPARTRSPDRSRTTSGCSRRGSAGSTTRRSCLERSHRLGGGDRRAAVPRAHLGRAGRRARRAAAAPATPNAASGHRRRARDDRRPAGHARVAGFADAAGRTSGRCAATGRTGCSKPGTSGPGCAIAADWHYLRALLAVPGQEITALDLVAGGAGLSAAARGAAARHRGRDAYRRRLAALEDELDAADAAGDSGPRAAGGTPNATPLLGELRRATGLGGRARGRLRRRTSGPGSTSPEPCGPTIDRITDAAPRAGAHLSASIHTGRACRYQPAPGGPARWHV